MLAVCFGADFFFDGLCFALRFFSVLFVEGFGEEFFFSWLRLDFFSAGFAETFGSGALGLDFVCLPWAFTDVKMKRRQQMTENNRLKN